VVGIDKVGVKTQIRILKKKRDQALAAHDKTQHKFFLRQIHRLKRKIHKATV